MSKQFQTSRYTGDLEELSKEDLIAKVTSLQAQVTQLKNLLAKARDGGNKAREQKKQRSIDFNKYNTRHVALKVAYLGWDYLGLATQELTVNDKTIERELFDALLKTRLIESRDTCNYHRSGRTDKGVSALGQVISIDLRSNLLEGPGVKVREGGTAHERTGDKTTEIPYVHILNKVLPSEIRVLAWAPVDPDFSARFSCLRRTYKYIFPRGKLNIQLMNEAAQKLLGEHDFRNLCKMDVGNGVVEFTRSISSAVVTEIEPSSTESPGYHLCELTIVGKAFLWHQIRCIVAVLFLVGEGQEKPEIIDELLDVEKHPRKPQYTMAREYPLVLFDCEYEDVNWIYEEGFHLENILHFQKMWCEQTVKSTMLKRMLDYLENSVSVTKSEDSKDPAAVLPWKQSGVAIEAQAECLIPGNKSAVHKSLLDRQVCDSLEDKVNYFLKRKKLTPDVASKVRKPNTQETESSDSAQTDNDIEIDINQVDRIDS